jgi:hypothetical protein
VRGDSISIDAHRLGLISQSMNEDADALTDDDGKKIKVKKVKKDLKDLTDSVAALAARVTALEGKAAKA